MKNEIIYSSARIVIETISSEVKDSDADIVISESGQINKKSRIVVYFGETKLTILFMWNHYSPESGVCVHYQEKQSLLFLGGGSLSAVLNLKSKEILHCNFPMLFWNWEIVEGNILELGELECRLYSPAGSLIGEAAVDPPYEYKVTPGVIEFSSIVVGKTYIKSNG